MNIVLTTESGEEVASFYVSDSQAELIRAAAASDGIDAAEWVRVAVLKAAYRT